MGPPGGTHHRNPRGPSERTLGADDLWIAVSTPCHAPHDWAGQFLTNEKVPQLSLRANEYNASGMRPTLE